MSRPTQSALLSSSSSSCSMDRKPVGVQRTFYHLYAFVSFLGYFWLGDVCDTYVTYTYVTYTYVTYVYVTYVSHTHMLHIYMHVTYIYVTYIYVCDNMSHTYMYFWYHSLISSTTSSHYNVMYSIPYLLYIYIYISLLFHTKCSQKNKTKIKHKSNLCLLFI